MKKVELPHRDLDDVILGNPAVFFQIQIQSDQRQYAIIRPVVFRPHLTVGLALVERW